MCILGFIGPQEIVIVLITVLVFSVFPIIALVDIAKGEFRGNNKLVWILIVLFLWVIGAILYYLVGRSQKIAKTE